VVDIYSGNALASDTTGCLLLRNLEFNENRLDISGLKDYNGIDVQDNGDNPWNDIPDIKWKLINDGEYQ